jgi:hypothetical protein
MARWTARQQIAVVRALADELERHLLHGADEQRIRDPMVQELRRLGRRCLEIAREIDLRSEGEG